MAAADGPDRFAPPHVRPALRRSAQNIIGQAIKRLPDPTVAVGGGAAGAVTAAAARSDAAAEIDAGAAARTAAPSPVLRLLPAIENEPEAPAGSGAHAPDARSAGAAAASASASAKAFVSATAIDMRCAADLACLIARCHKAPCGKGAATVVDERVRQTLELDADACTVDCGGRLEAEVLPEIKRQLSLQHLNLRAQLHKVLVYRPGDFFKPHRDNLKDPRHHLTLVLDLGAEHQGGEIEFFDAVGLSRRRFRERAERGWLRHTERCYLPRIVYDAAIEGDEASDPFLAFETAGGAGGGAWAAWFTTTWHAVRPLRHGTRVVAMYNILADEVPPRDILSCTPPSKAFEAACPCPSPTPTTPTTSADGPPAATAGRSVSEESAGAMTAAAAKLDQLPPELILAIAEHLDLASAAALAATCRWLHSIFPPAQLLACGIRAEMGAGLALTLGWRGLDRLGFVLAHPYAMEEDASLPYLPYHPDIVAGDPEQQQLRVQPWRLHGRDRVLYDALSLLHFAVELPSALVVVEQKKEVRYGFISPSSVNVARAAVDIPMEELLGDDIVGVSSMAWRSQDAEISEVLGLGKTLPLSDEAAAVFAAAGEPIERIDKRDCPRLCEPFVIENDGIVQATYIPFRGVFWMQCRDDHGAFAAHVHEAPEFELEDLWGNEGMFDILAYQTAVCMATPSPPPPRMWPYTLLSVRASAHYSYFGTSLLDLDDRLANLYGD